MTIIITGVANTGGRAASLNRFARCSGWTARVKEPLAPGSICLKACLRTSRERALRWHPTETTTWRGCAQLLAIKVRPSPAPGFYTLAREARLFGSQDGRAR